MSTLPSPASVRPATPADASELAALLRALDTVRSVAPRVRDLGRV